MAPKPYWYKPGGYATDHLIQGMSDPELMAHMGVPEKVALNAIAMSKKPMHETIEYWVENLDRIYRPQYELAKESPDLFGKGLIFYGPGGTRKTTTAAALLLRVIRMGIRNTDPSHRNHTWHGWCMGQFIDWQDASAEFRRAVSDEAADARAEVIRNRLRGAGPQLTAGNFVVIDDISRERNTEFNSGELQRPLRHRENYGYPAIITTNYAPAAWERVYGDVLAAFMDRAFYQVEFKQ